MVFSLYVIEEGIGHDGEEDINQNEALTKAFRAIQPIQV